MSTPPPAPLDAAPRGKPERPARPGPSARFIVIRWLVALAALLLMGATSAIFLRTSDRDTPPHPEPVPAR